MGESDAFDFIAQWGLTSYTWKKDMYNFYLGYTSCVEKAACDGFILSSLYYLHVARNEQAMKELANYFGKFEARLTETIKKHKPKADEVECLLPHCHIVMKREMPLQDYSRIPASEKSITVKDLYSYEYNINGFDVLIPSNVAWQLTLDPKYSDSQMDDTLKNARNAFLSRSNVDCLLKAYENNAEYKGNLPKILLKSAGMTFVSKTAVDTTKLCMLTETAHGYNNEDASNIPLILPSSNYWNNRAASMGGSNFSLAPPSSNKASTVASNKIVSELGGYDNYLFALTGYKYNNDAAKAYKVGKLTVTEDKKRYWYTLWMTKETYSYTIHDITDVENNLWLVPYVTKRYNKSAAWEY